MNCPAQSENSRPAKPYKDLISETGIDVVEGFPPPPVGDLSISEFDWRGEKTLL